MVASIRIRGKSHLNLANFKVSWSVNALDIMPILLLVLFLLALSTGTGMVMLIVRRSRQRFSDNSTQKLPISPVEWTHVAGKPSYLRRPSCWLAIKSRNLALVQAAFGLHNTKPCSWRDGLANGEKLFIAPPVNGWVIVVGSDLPDPNEDVDACFRFILGLSRKLGQVQFFHASRIVNHHAWARAEKGKIVRAYAWAGKTLWIQGRQTAAEVELGLKCFDYFENAPLSPYSYPDFIGQNVDKVPLLASRWSLDPAAIDEQFLEEVQGVAGEACLRY